MVIAETRFLSVAVGASLVAAAFAVTALGKCGRPHRATATSVAWDGHVLTAVWERSDGRDGSTVFLHRFAELRSGVTTIGSGTPIYHRKYGRSRGIPEIASDARGSIIITLGSLEDHFAIPLDATGAVAGPAQPLTTCSSDSSERVCMRVCRRVVSFGGGFAFGHLDAWPRSGRLANVVAVSFLSRDGKTLRNVTLRGGIPSGCALASTGSRLVVAVAEERLDHSLGIRIQAVDDADRDDLWIPDAIRAIALVPDDVDMTLLYEMRDGTLRVARIDDHEVREPVVLPADVDAGTVDLGIGKKGPFVTWTDGKRVFVHNVATAKRARGATRGAKSFGTRAAGAGTRCVAAWSAGDGAKIGVLTAACP